MATTSIIELTTPDSTDRQLVSVFSPRVLVIGGGILVLGAMLYGSTLHEGIPYFPNLVLPITVGGFGIGMIVVPLTVSAIAGVSWGSSGCARRRWPAVR